MTLPVDEEVIAAFGQNYEVRRSIRLLDLDHNVVVDDVGSLFVDGQVNVAQGAEISRSATIDLFDPLFRLGLDSPDPDGRQVAARYLVEIKKGLRLDSWDDFVDIPVGVLWGNRFVRNGDILTIEAQGKEAILLYPFARQDAPVQPYTIPAGTDKLSAIADLLELAGEIRLRFEEPGSASTITTPIVLTSETSIWAVCQQIVASMGWILFYDAEGYVVARPSRSADGFAAGAAYTFAGGPGGVLRNLGEIGNDAQGMTNAVIATGATPTGKSAPLIAAAHVVPDDALDLVRNGVRLWLPAVTSNDAATTQVATQAVANAALGTAKIGSSVLAFTSSPVWHLEEGDPCWLTDPVSGADAGFIWGTNVSIPLGLGDQTNGFLRKVYRRNPKFRLRSAA